jgi:hypothetical protein
VVGVDSNSSLAAIGRGYQNVLQLQHEGHENLTSMFYQKIKTDLPMNRTCTMCRIDLKMGTVCQQQVENVVCQSRVQLNLLYLDTVAVVKYQGLGGQWVMSGRVVQGLLLFEQE